MARVVGVETEYGILLYGRDTKAIAADEAANALFRYRLAGYRNMNMFLPSGGRLYLDVGAHPEYASAECGTIDELIANLNAGESELLQMAEKFQQAQLLEDAKYPNRELHIFKNNADSYGNTYGLHENYAVTRALDVDLLVATVSSFIATRVFYQGNGDFGNITWSAGQGESYYPSLDSQGGLAIAGPHQAKISFATRARYLKKTTSADTTGERALINTRDEPLADKSQWRRLHVTGADSNICEFSQVISVGLLSMILDLLERDNTAFADLVLSDPLQAFQSASTGALKEITLANGGISNALEIQKEFLRRIKTAAKTQTFSFTGEKTLEIISIAEKVFSAFENSRLEDLLGYLDWATKAVLFTQKINRQLAKLDSEMAAADLVLLAKQFDLSYHDLHPRLGLVQLLKRHGKIKSWEHGLDITQPPAHSRASLRGAFISAALNKKADFTVSWNQIRLDSPPTSPVDLPDPLEQQNEEVERLIKLVREKAETSWIDKSNNPYRDYYQRWHRS